jgi:polysaccharide biosynthesis/export protein
MGVLAITLYAADTTPPKELVQYVRDANKLGLKDSQIRENAVQAGWPVAKVNEAIAYAHSHGGPTQDSISKHEAPISDPTPVNSGAASTSLNAPSTPPPSRVSAAPPGNPAANNPPARAGGEPVLRPAAPETQEGLKSHGVPEDYTIGEGDVLQISVWKEPDASVPSVVVRPDGKIAMPIIKEIQVIGLRPVELEKAITERLSKFIPAADVTVVVSAINSKKIYVLGAVKKEGPIPYNYRMTVMQALSEAGGLNDYAKRKKIYVLRTENGKEYRLSFNYDAVLKGEHMELNIPLMPGDTLVIPH